MNRKANTMVVVAISLLLLLVVGGFLVAKLTTPAPQSSVAPTPSVNSADIDRSGAADEGDKLLIRNQIGCVKDQPCWNRTIGKTKDGDNPLYVFDLDLDKNGSITQADLDLVK